MADTSNTTTNHRDIRRWAEARGGKPAIVEGTAKGGEGAGILRIDFPDAGRDADLKEVSWDTFFRTFDEKKLAFLYQDKTSDGNMSRFNKFISRD